MINRMKWLLEVYHDSHQAFIKTLQNVIMQKREPQVCQVLFLKS